MALPGFITKEGLRQLKRYQYKSGQYTWLDNKMNPYWEWVVRLVPMTVAPNLITFIGWILVILSYALMLCFDYTFQKDIPSYCFFFAAFCIFAYSTLDAIDGKQARRTKSSSPLGQLFDHGCDSFSITFFILCIGQAAKLSDLEIFMTFLASQTAFWTSNWMEYNTGILKTNVGQFGVTESELICMVVHLVTGFFGQNVWQISLGSFLPSGFGAGNELLTAIVSVKLGGFIALYVGGLIVVLCVYSFFDTILKSPNKIKPIKQCLTFYIILVFEILWYRLSFFDKYSGLVLLNFGLLSSLIICKVIISSVAKMALPYFHIETAPLIVSTILMLICQFFHLHESMIYIFWGFFLVNLCVILRFLYVVINQITDYLGISCFSLGRREPAYDSEDEREKKKLVDGQKRA